MPAVKQSGKWVFCIHFHKPLFIGGKFGDVLNNQKNADDCILVIAQRAQGAALLHVVEYCVKRINRLEREEKTVQFLGKKREISEGEDRLAVPGETRIVEVREKIEQGRSNNFFVCNPAVKRHPPVPVPDIIIPVKDNQTDIYGVEYLGKFIHIAP